MEDFNPELYLRLLGEREVATVDETRRFPRRANVLEAAAALVSCGLMATETAGPVVEDYAAAVELRHRHGLAGPPLRVRAHRPDAEPGQLRPRRVLSCGTELESTRLGRVHVRWVSAIGNQITLGVSTDQSTSSAGQGLSPSVEVVTADGQRVLARLSGTPEQGYLEARFPAPVSTDVGGTWLSIDGTPIVLEPSVAEVDISVQRSTVTNPAIAYLWQMLADFSDIRGQPPGVEAALAAFQAAGRIRADDEALAALAWVANRAAPVEYVGQRTGRTSPPSIDPPPTTPEEWRGLAGGRTGAFSGPERTLGIGAVTPVFDGVCLAVEAIRSNAHSFSLDIEIVGVPLSYRGYAQLRRNPLAFWARDDRNNSYLGHIDEWTGDLDGHSPARASIEFAALDPAAAELTVSTTTVRARALIRIPL